MEIYLEGNVRGSKIIGCKEESEYLRSRLDGYIFLSLMSVDIHYGKTVHLES